MKHQCSTSASTNATVYDAASSCMLCALTRHTHKSKKERLQAKATRKCFGI